jgi:uncharacterized protein
MADLLPVHTAARPTWPACGIEFRGTPAGGVVVAAVVSGLYYYPVKSARGCPALRARLAPTGFEWDRQWMTVDPKGTFLSQRTHPHLARIVPEMTPTELVLQAAGMSALRVPLEVRGERLPVRVWKDACIGIDQGPAAHAWVSRVLGAQARLVRVAPDMERNANPEFAGSTPAPIGFPDSYPLLVCNEASLEDLNARLPQRLGIERFRPNIVLRGLEAWAEDHIDTLTIGAVKLRLVKPCTRCSIPSRDPITGEAATDPLPVLRQFRFNRTLLGVTFGENAVIVQGVGDEIERGAPCRVSLDETATPGESPATS